MGRKKTRAADIRRRLKEDPDPSPFAGIKLVEKKEPEKKASQKKPPLPPRKPSEIVQGYNPSSSFADILYAYEHTGNPYMMPSASKKQEIASKPTDFGAILDKWEGRTAAPKKKASSSAPAAKSVYKPTRSFADILSSFEGTAKPAASGGKAPEKERVDSIIPDPDPLFRRESEDEKRSPEASWSIFGGNDSFVRKEEKKAEEPGKKDPPQRASKPYSPTKSFADILSSYERREPVRKEKQPEAPKSSQPAADLPDEAPLFRRESEDEKRSPEAVWSVFGNNRIPERPDKAPEEALPSNGESRGRAGYHPSSDFSSILSRYEKRSEKTFDEIMKEKGDRSQEKPQLTVSRLRSMLPQAILDLHGYTVSEAESRVKAFLGECRDNGLRKISIITGKGLHSEDGVGVLRDAVIRVLDESGTVSEKFSAPQSAGGSGALWIILKA